MTVIQRSLVKQCSKKGGFNMSTIYKNPSYTLNPCLLHNEPHIYNIHLIEYDVVDHADSVTSSKVCVVLLSPMDNYQISSLLEKEFNIPYMKPVDGYAEMRTNNPYRVNHIYDEQISFSLDVDNPKVFVEEFEHARSRVLSFKNTRFIIMSYNKHTNEYSFGTATQTDVITVLEQKLDTANKKIALKKRKPVQQILKKIKALSPQDKALLTNYLTEEQ